MEERSNTRTGSEEIRVASNQATNSEANLSGVSWSAVFAGAFVSAALGLILLSLGTGLGLSSVSFWSNTGASTATISKAAIVWLIVMEIMSSAMGGYIAGRLRTKWAAIHSDEVYFRDTAHGFLAWSVSLVLTAAFLTSAAASLVGSSASSAEVTKSSQSENRDFGSVTYFVDSLFRAEAPKPEPSSAALGPEVLRAVSAACFALPKISETRLSASFSLKPVLPATS